MNRVISALLFLTSLLCPFEGLTFDKNPLPPALLGPLNVEVGELATYEYDAGTTVPSPSWSVTYGVVQDTYHVGNAYYCQILWTQAGSGTVSFYQNTNTLLGTRTISIDPLPAPNTTFTKVNNCGNTVVTRNSNPPAHVEWYWQISNSGMSTALGTATSISRTTPGTMYLRARLAEPPHTWSQFSQSAGGVTINAQPAAPATATNGAGFAGSVITLSVSAVSGATSYKWYLIEYGDVALPWVTSNTHIITSAENTITYYVAAVNAACESATRTPVTATVAPAPVIQAIGNSSVIMGTSVTLEANGSYDTHSWRNSANAEVGTQSSFTTTLPGTYRVVVTKSGIPGSRTSQPFIVGDGLEGQNLNYIVSNTILVGGITNVDDITSLSVTGNSQVIQYLDGLGRPKQTVTTQGSSAKADLVQPVVYDAFGRELRKYLPYVHGNDGRLKTVTYDAEGNFTGNAGNTYGNNPTGMIAQDSRPFAETVFEASPLNRPEKSYGAGSAWAPETTGNPDGQDKYVAYQYLVNVHTTDPSATGEKIIAWEVNTSGNPVRAEMLEDYIEAGGYYSTGQISIQGSTDEHGNAVREYKNKEGQVILKKVQVVSPSTNLNGTTDWAMTYYIYDDFGSLRYVFQPELSKKLHNGADSYLVTATDLTNFAFQYKYDARRRMIEKTVPGASTVYMVYDNRDRLVATQDGVQRAANPKRWTFTKYDQLNRPIATGIKDTVTLLTQAEMQDAVDVHYAKSWARYGEEYIGETGTVHGYTNLSFPVTTGQETSYDIGVLNVNKYLTITYYDNYDFRALWTGEYDYKSDALAHTVNGIEYEQPGDLEYNQRVVGQVTGMKLKSLDNGYFWLKSVNYYDDKYRVIQTVGDNLKAGTDRISNLYDFVGKILKSKTTHGKDNIVWTERVGVKTEGNKLIRTAAGNDWTSSGAVSEERLQAGQDGWVEFIVSESHTARVLGLSDVNTNASNNTIDYAFSLSNNILRVLENGAVKLTISGAHKPEYVLRIERSGSTISYKRNGVTVYTSLTPSASLLMVDASIYNGNATLVSVRSSFSLSSQTVSRRFEYDHAGRLLDIYHLVGPEPQKVTWTSLVGVEESNGGLTKTSVSQSWNAGAFSQESLMPGENGYVEFRTQLTKRKIVGFSDANTSVHHNTIDYALYATQTGVLYAYENGVSMAMLGHYTEQDVLRIERIDSKIYYKMNNAVLYESTIPSNTVLHVDCSLYDPGASIFDVNMGISTIGEVRLVHNEYNELGQLVDKKLHSQAGSAFKQSVDYRYNIRGWLTSINDASLTGTGPTNNETGDYFGMNLSYNEADAGLGNDEMFNGNISGIKWSNYLGTATIKEKGYTYDYDPMNRILGSTFKEKASAWSAPINSANAETGFEYDLNGNIQKLKRNDTRSTGLMDDLLYVYGTGAAQSNKLLRVTDLGDDSKGFVDGNPGSGTDYTYDANGNMLHDFNKAIAVDITYNYLNLPERVTRGGNTVHYIYDAIGRKLCQVTTFSDGTKQTDYAGEFTYENDALQFISHEEGRAVVAGNKLVYTNTCESTAGMTASNATLATATIDEEEYIMATANGTVARTGIFPIGDEIIVEEGERYKIRAKGFRFKGTAASSKPAYLLIQAGGNDLGWPGAALPEATTAAGQTESWIEQTVTIPANATTLEAGVAWNTVLDGEVFYLNEFEIIKLESTEPEYQYFMKDHLGNVRLTFTTKEDKESALATLETANAATEESQFLYYDEAITVDHVLFDHTDAGPTYYSTRLTGGNTNAKFGLTKTLSLMPGDVVNMDVYAKYLDPTSSNWTVALNNFIASINGGSPPTGSIVDGGVAGSIGGGTYPIVTINHTSESGTPPKAYLNYVVLDKSMENVLDMGYARITANSREYGQDATHDHLVLNYTAKEPGYIYIYLSNENPTTVEVYFDDFKVKHTKSPVVGMEDYYPFGLIFKSYLRENAKENRYLYNQGTGEKKFNTERVFDLGLNVDMTKFRVYDPAIGRWWQPDPLANEDDLVQWTPYNYSFNNPIRYNDPLGDNPQPPRRPVHYRTRSAQSYKNIVRSQQVRTSYTHQSAGRSTVTTKPSVIRPTTQGKIVNQLIEAGESYREFAEKLKVSVEKVEVVNTSAVGGQKTESSKFVFFGPESAKLEAAEMRFQSVFQGAVDQKFSDYASQKLGTDFNSLSPEAQADFRTGNSKMASAIAIGVSAQMGPSPKQHLAVQLQDQMQRGIVVPRVAVQELPTIRSSN